MSIDTALPVPGQTWTKESDVKITYTTIKLSFDLPLSQTLTYLVGLLAKKKKKNGDKVENKKKNWQKGRYRFNERYYFTPSVLSSEKHDSEFCESLNKLWATAKLTVELFIFHPNQ